MLVKGGIRCPLFESLFKKKKKSKKKVTTMVHLGNGQILRRRLACLYKGLAVWLSTTVIRTSSISVIDKNDTKFIRSTTCSPEQCFPNTSTFLYSVGIDASFPICIPYAFFIADLQAHNGNVLRHCWSANLFA